MQSWQQHVNDVSLLIVSALFTHTSFTLYDSTTCVIRASLTSTQHAFVHGFCMSTYIGSQLVAVLTLYGMYAILKVPAVVLAHIATVRESPCLNLT
jgi:hypothetical protein